MNDAYQGKRQTGRLLTYIGVCIILVQAGLINITAQRFGKVGPVGFGATFCSLDSA